MTFQTTSDIERRLAGRNETATYVGVLSRAVPAAKVALTDAMYLPIPSSVIDFSGPLAVGAAYARFSNRKQDRRSIGVQKESINSILPFWHARISDDMWFADEAKPGKKKLGREQLDEMLQCARAGGFRYLFVEDVSRLARSIGDMGTIREELLELGIEIISAFDGGVVSNMHIAFKGLHAADFLTDLTLRIKRSNVRLRREGFILGPPGFGFEPVPGDKGRPRLVAKQVEIVQAAFKMFVHEDLEYPEILKRFEELDYRWSDGTPFDQQRLKTLFVRILYAGCQVTDPYYDQPGPKVRRPLSEAEIVVIEKYRIVDRETVEASIAKVEANKYGKKYAPALKHVLSGLVRCGNDQSLVAGERTEPRGNFLECRREGGCLCKWPVRAYFGEVLPGVLDAVGKAVAAPELRDQFVRDYNARAKQLELAQPTRAGELREIVKQIDGELAERGRVLHALSGSPVAFQASLAEIDGLELRKKGFQDELLAVGQDVAPIIARQDAVKIWNAAFAEMTAGADSVLDKASNPRLFDLFRQVVKGVVLERTPGPVPFSVTVEFSFAAFVVKANGAPFRESTTCLLPAPYKLIDLPRKTGYAVTRPFEPDFAAGDFDDQTWLRIKMELGLPDFNRLAHDPRRAISGMFYKLRGGCIWKEVPERYRPSFLPFKLYQDMRADGSLARLLVFMKEEMPEQLSELSPEWVEKAISGRKLGNRDFSCRGQPPKSIKPRKAPVYNIKRSKSVDEHMEYIVHRLDGDPVVPAAQIWREVESWLGKSGHWA